MGPPEFQRELAVSMENVARTITEVPADVVESQLVTFDMFVNLFDVSQRPRAAELLRQAALHAREPGRAARLNRAAEDVAAARPCALTPEGLTAQQAVAASSLPGIPVYEVGEFFKGLKLRVVQEFVDFDGDAVHAGEILHFEDGSYFHYDGGHTLNFREKTIRLAEIEPANNPVICNAGNEYFEAVVDLDALRSLWRMIDEQWGELGWDQKHFAPPIRAELDRCGAWLAAQPSGAPPPVCYSGERAVAAVQGYGSDRTLARQLQYFFAALSRLAPTRPAP
jgi:hypothetical protein